MMRMVSSIRAPVHGWLVYGRRATPYKPTLRLAAGRSHDVCSGSSRALGVVLSGVSAVRA
jgi:hypothetical protein